MQIIPMTSDTLFNPYPFGDLPWQKYQAVRNAIFEVSRNCGTAGPMGAVKIDDGVESPYLQAGREPDFWPLGDSNPQYYIVDDQYNDDMFSYVELAKGSDFTADWLTAILSVLHMHNGWAVSVAMPNARIFIFEDKLIVDGALAHCKTVDEVLATALKLDH